MARIGKPGVKQMNGRFLFVAESRHQRLLDDDGHGIFCRRFSRPMAIVRRFGRCAAGGWFMGWITVAAGEYEIRHQRRLQLAQTRAGFARWHLRCLHFQHQRIRRANRQPNNIYTHAPYNNPLSVLGPPTLQFYDIYDSRATNESSHKIIEPAYWTLTRIQATRSPVRSTRAAISPSKWGAPIYHNPNNPYGIGLHRLMAIHFIRPDIGGSIVSDLTDDGFPYRLPASPALTAIPPPFPSARTAPIGSPILMSRFFSRATPIDGTTPTMRGERGNSMNPNPSIQRSIFRAGVMVSNVLDQYVGANGGTGYNLQASGLPWIQYIRITAGTNLTDTAGRITPSLMRLAR